MLHSIPPNQEEQYNGHTNANETHNKNSPLIEHEYIEGTPFHYVRRENEHFLTMGNYRITESTNTKQEAIEKLETESWKIIMHMILITQEKSKQFEETDQISKSNNQ